MKSGEIRNVLFSAEPITVSGQECMIGVTTDITEQKRAEKALKDSEKFSSSLMRNSAIPILVVNGDTSVRYVNPSFEELTGFSSAEVVGKKAPMPWWIENQDSGSIDKFKKTIINGARGLEKIFQKKDGKQFWVEVTSVPVKRGGKFVFSLLNWLDITERKQMENELLIHRDHLEELVHERTAELTTVNDRLQHE